MLAQRRIRSFVSFLRDEVLFFNTTKKLDPANCALFHSNTRTFSPERPFCALAHYSPDGTINADLLTYMDCFVECGADLVLVSASGELRPDALAAALERCPLVVVRPNVGYDFYSWKTACEAYPSFADRDCIIWTNDSVIVEPHGAARFLHALMRADGDFVGATDCLRYGRHLQSYLLKFSRGAANSKEFHDFLRSMNVHRHKGTIIRRLEVGLSKALGGRFGVMAMIESSSFSAREYGRRRRTLNPTIDAWADLIAKRGFPFVKRELITKRGVERERIEELFSKISESAQSDKPGGIASVSVAMTTFNGERFLREQLESLLFQSYPIFEIVISDDGSTDGTMEILLEFSARDSRFRILKNSERLGYVKNFEHAIRACRGSIIFLSDQDDIWVPSKTSALVDALPGRLLVYSDAELIDSTGATLLASFDQAKGLGRAEPGILAILNGNFVTGCTIAFDRRLLGYALPFPDCIPHDRWLSLVAAACGGLYRSTSILTRYRQHGNNVLGAGLSLLNRFERAEVEPKAAVRNRLDFCRRRASFIHYATVALGRLLDSRDLEDAGRLERFYSSYENAFVRPASTFFVLSRGRRAFPTNSGARLIRKALRSFIGYRLDRHFMSER